MTKIQEIWKDIEIFNGHYKVSNYGRVMNSKTGLIRKISISTTGYPATSFSYNGLKYYKKIHRLVAIAFLDNPDNKQFINHKDGNKENNHFTNLEWCTFQENIRHAFQNNLMIPASGENSHKSKLKNHEVLSIIELHKNGHSQRNIASKFKISRRNVRSIIYGKSWLKVTNQLVSKNILEKA